MTTSRSANAALTRAAIVLFMAFATSVACAQTVLRTSTLAFPPPAGEPVGAWSGHSFIVIEGAGSGAPVLHVHDASGAEVQRVAIRIPDAQWGEVHDNRFAQSEDGRLAVAGSAYGAGDRAANFVAVIAPDGSSQQVVRTTPWAPTAPTFAADGSLWVAGRGDDTIGKDYFLIRRFDRSGKLLGESLPRASLPGGPSPASGSRFVASRDRVGWLAPWAHTYVEFSLDGKELAAYPANVSLDDLAGIALCEDNNVWMSIDADPNAKRTPVQKPGYVPRSILTTLDRVRSTWSASEPRPFTYVCGCSGNALVGMSAAPNQIVWLATR